MLPRAPLSTLFPYTTLFRSPIWSEGKLTNKTFSAMASAQNPHGGQETTLQTLYITAMHWGDRKSTRLNSSHVAISYAVFCLKKKKKYHKQHHNWLIANTKK